MDDCLDGFIICSASEPQLCRATREVGWQSVAALCKTSTHFHAGGRALDLLDEHYAKGDINREEYQQRKQDILGR